MCGYNISIKIFELHLNELIKNEIAVADSIPDSFYPESNCICINNLNKKSNDYLRPVWPEFLLIFREPKCPVSFQLLRGELPSHRECPKRKLPPR